ncbi:regulatory protein RecX [Sphingomicrobium astaxanthinifaciens]|uniref:regulatory protein RecX n=1 Tax=Sphingomicrobium astaxanthinifaciens TaxID=1227949 RepID=UPI001FCACB71|nr:RecX family transcriptional regulator [Sphingomicrobium astaxanthinifaciens]MCJ7421793.1 RecX family transcriptional regulator [Sphingomicrobium astaxanthinifaciens]
MKRPRPPLESAQIEALALRYVERFATTRAKLGAYLARKVRERGWAGEPAASEAIAALVERFAERGYVDDRSFAEAKARDLTLRGYGARRLDQALYGAGVGEGDADGARAIARAGAVEAALKFAARRRLGPFAQAAIEDPRQRQRALAAFQRAGHGFRLAAAILDLAPGTDPDPEALEEES